MNTLAECPECGLKKYTTKNDKERGRCNICSGFKQKIGIDDHVLLDELIHRNHYVGLYRAGHAAGVGYAEVLSLKRVMEVGQRRLKELNVLHLQVKKHPKDHFIHKDRSVIALLAERSILMKLTKEAEGLVDG